MDAGGAGEMEMNTAAWIHNICWKLNLSKYVQGCAMVERCKILSRMRAGGMRFSFHL